MVSNMILRDASSWLGRGRSHTEHNLVSKRNVQDHDRFFRQKLFD
jgi:hypothetical protein